MEKKGKTGQSIAYFLLSQLVSFAGSYLISSFFPERPLVPDLLFILIPPVLWLEYLSEPLIFGSIAILLYHIICNDRKNLSYYLYSVGSVYMIRAFLMILTPLGRPMGNLTPYGLFKYLGITQHGMFPSGHAALAFVIYLLIPGSTHKKLRNAAGILCTLQIAVLIISRGHYSIDIAGGILVSWAVWSFYKIRLENS